MTKIMRTELQILAFLFLAESSALEWNDCGGSEVDVRRLSLTPPVPTFPGEAYLAYTADVKKDIIDAKLELSIKKKAFFLWIPIPCVSIGEIPLGSCSYDICDTITHHGNIICPILAEMSIPCSCPLVTGQYKADRAVVRLPKVPTGLGFLTSGTYYIEAKAKVGNEQILCLDVTVEVQA
ncbi:uncharacterized protein LOC141914960 [Tubulanus polymorphus]|uniref:uncharacterized protein LOC141914960 n=1 Tax=Tubulanus polymorphus TaxID=672921 RepID=UPI003DA5B009